MIAKHFAGVLALVLGSAVPGGAAECEVAGVPATAADTARARTACQVARARFAELFGDPVPNVRVILQDRAGYRAGIQGITAAILWPTTRAMEARVGRGAAAKKHIEEQWRDVLPHEITHALLAVRFDGAWTEPPSAGYGTSFPDWFDEGVAIRAESIENRRARLAQARALPAARRDLRSIVASRHPAQADTRLLAIRDGAAPPPDRALWDFYSQAIAVLEFVFQKGGQAAIRELAARYIADPNDPDALAGLPGLPSTLEGVVAAWEEWIAGAGS